MTIHSNRMAAILRYQATVLLKIGRTCLHRLLVYTFKNSACIRLIKNISLKVRHPSFLWSHSQQKLTIWILYVSISAPLTMFTHSMHAANYQPFDSACMVWLLCNSDPLIGKNSIPGHPQLGVCLTYEVVNQTQWLSSTDSQLHTTVCTLSLSNIILEHITYHTKELTLKTALSAP